MGTAAFRRILYLHGLALGDQLRRVEVVFPPLLELSLRIQTLVLSQAHAYEGGRVTKTRLIYSIGQQ